MNKTIITLLGFFAMAASAQTSIVSPAQAGKQCSSDKQISLSCMNPDGYDDPKDRHDVRLYITETQKCKDGNISSLSKLEQGFIFGEEMTDTKTQVEHVGQRVQFNDLEGNITAEVPKSATIQSQLSKYELAFTTEAVPFFEGAKMENGQYGLNGSFKKVDSQGAVLATGRILCLISK